MNKQKILIVGGGFAGVKVALELAGDQRFELTLLSDRRDFRYYPSLYRIALGGTVTQASIPLTEIFADKAVKVVQDSARELDRGNKQVKLESGSAVAYDILIISLGVVTNYFGIKGLEEYSYGIKSVDDAEALKKHLHQQLTDEHKPDLNYIIVGGGPTGIELAGALPDYLHRLIKTHSIRSKNIRIDLVEAASSLVPRLPQSVGGAIARQLQRENIHLYLGETVEGETADNLMLGDQHLPSHTVIWTAGVTNHPFFKTNNFTLTDKGKVVVDKQLQAEPDIFVLGDNADTLYSGMAQTAVHNARFVAKLLKSPSKVRASLAYQPKRPIYVMPAGPNWAAVCWGKVHFYGRLGWWLREAADIKALHELLAWPQAFKKWLSEFHGQEECLICAQKQRQA